MLELLRVNNRLSEINFDLFGLQANYSLASDSMRIISHHITHANRFEFQPHMRKKKKKKKKIANTTTCLHLSHERALGVIRKLFTM